MSVRASVRVFDVVGGKATESGSVPTPEVFKVHVRPDIVQTVVARLHLNLRQAYAVSDFAGYQTAAESWGTGRAVARVPRVPGRGSHRSGQAAFANFCRGGGMFAPTKTFRKWTRQTPSTTRKHAQAYAVAGSGVTSLVAARGHRVETVEEFPIVCANSLEKLTKTSEVVAYLKGLGLGAELERCEKSKKIRAGKGKFRNRKYQVAKGPLVVYKEGEAISKSCRNILGVDSCSVAHLDTRMLAPGGRPGRMVVYTESAFKYLNTQFGDASGNSVKGGYRLPRTLVAGNSVDTIIMSEQIQSVVRPKMVSPVAKKPSQCYPNPLKNKAAMQKLNPASEKMAALKK